METQPATGSAVGEGAPFLAADVGGTNARLALVRRDADGAIEILDHRRYACADFPGLAAIVADFLSGSGRGAVQDAAIGCAGIPQGDTIVSLNLPWPVSLAELRGLGIARVAAVNDFAAVAHAGQCMEPDSSILLCGDPDAAIPGPTLLVGAGTGLGAAYRIPFAGGTVVLPSEAGQMAFAPGNPRELAVLGRMLASASRVAVTDIASGPGLLRLYRELSALDGMVPHWATPAEVVEAAQAGDARAVEAVRMFCDVLGAVAGDLAVAGMASRVYIAGGIVPRIRDFLAGSAFQARFAERGVMRGAMERVPVRLIDDPHLGVIGAAAWYLRGVAGGAAPATACA